jgi:hypothetical protein
MSEDMLESKLNDLLSYNLGKNIITKNVLIYSKKIYEKTKSISYVLDYITENLLDISANYSNIIENELKNEEKECKNHVRKFINNITTKQIQGYEKMMVLLSYYHMTEMYDKEINIRNGNKNFTESYKFFEINYIIKKDFYHKKKNITIKKNKKIKICNIVYVEGEHKLICHGYYDENKFIKFENVIEIPNSYIDYNNSERNLRKILKLDLLKEPIEIYKKLNFIEEYEYLHLINILEEDNLNNILKNIDVFIKKVMFSRLNENSQKNSETLKKKYEKLIEIESEETQILKLRELKKEYYLKCSKNNSMRNIYESLINYLRLKSKYLNILDFSEYNISINKIPNYMLDDLNKVVDKFQKKYYFENNVINNLKIKLKEGKYLKLFHVLINYYFSVLDDKQKTSINVKLYEDSYLLLDGLIKVKLNGILDLMKDITYTIISKKNDKIIKTESIDKYFQKKFELKVKESFGEFKKNDNVEVYQLFKYKNNNDKTAFFVNKNKIGKIIPTTNTNVSSKILMKFKKNSLIKLNKLFEILFKENFKYEKDLSNLIIKSNSSNLCELECSNLLKKYKNMDEIKDFADDKYYNKSVDDINKFLVKHILFKNLEKYSNLLKKYNQNISLLNTAISELIYKEEEEKEQKTNKRLNMIEKSKKDSKNNEEKIYKFKKKKYFKILLKNIKIEKKELAELKKKKELAEIKRQKKLSKIRKQKELTEIKMQKELAEIKRQKELAEIKMQKELAEIKRQKELAEIKRQKELAEIKRQKELAEIKRQKELEEKRRKNEMEKRNKILKKMILNILKKKLFKKLKNNTIKNKIIKIKKEVLKSIKKIGDEKLMEEMFEKYKLTKLNEDILINQKDLLKYLINLDENQKLKWSELEKSLIRKRNENNEYDNISESTEEIYENESREEIYENESREWMFINSRNCMFPEVFTKKEMIDLYIGDKIYINTLIKNIYWERGTGYISLINTELYNELPQMYREFE